jgi:hypothetical protein
VAKFVALFVALLVALASVPADVLYRAVQHTLVALASVPLAIFIRQFNAKKAWREEAKYNE